MGRSNKNKENKAVIMTDDSDGNPVEYTMEDIQREMDNDTEIGRYHKEMMVRSEEKIKQLKK